MLRRLFSRAVSEILSTARAIWSRQRAIAAVAAAVVGDAAEPARGQVEHLVFKRIGEERPTVAEDDGLAASPVLVEEAGAISGGDKSHGMVSLVAEDCPLPVPHSSWDWRGGQENA